MSDTSPSTTLPHRILHTMLRVSDLEKSVSFYCEKLGMREFRREDYSAGRFTLSFIGYGNEEAHSVIELTYNYDNEIYEHGTGFGHIALAVRDIHATCDRLASQGVEILRQPGPMTHTADTGQRDVIAFIADPDGYRIELIEGA